MKYFSNSPSDTAQIAIEILKSHPKTKVFALFDELGAGKTAFVHGFARELLCIDSVQSPTFAIVNEYRDKTGAVILRHFDMYRIGGESELFDIGWEDYLAQSGIIAVEWSENVENALPSDSLKIEIKKTGEHTREIEVL